MLHVAVPTQDGTTIAHHFGRSKRFLIFEIEGRTVTGHTVRENTFTGHARGDCHHGHDHGQGQPHQHGQIVEALADCEVVLCHGMGWRAAAALREGGIKAYILQEELSPREAVTKYLSGELSLAEDFCQGRH
jgi:predicted Fe-Mo cluster-binding NifX family protein